MSLRPQGLLSTALVLALALPPVGHQPLAQDQDQQTPPAQEAPPGSVESPDSPDSDDAVEPLASRSDRLTVRVGAAGMHMRAVVRGDNRFLGPFYRLTEVNEVKFEGGAGGLFVADAWYEVSKGWYLVGSVATGSTGSEDMTDSRMISRKGGPGEFDMAVFSSEYDADYLEWSLGGARRIFPNKRFKDSRMYLDLMMLFSGTSAEYAFDAGELTENPYNPDPLNPAFGFDPLGRAPASYDLDYTFLLTGFRFGGRFTDRLFLEGTFMPAFFGRFEGSADLGPHGTKFVHEPGISHQVAFSDPAGGVVESDLFLPDLQVEQESHRVSGLKVGINSYVKFKDWLTLDFGFYRNFIRSVGGKETRRYSEDILAGCPSPGFADPGDPTTILPPECKPDYGDLIKASLVSDVIYVMGRFQLY